MMGLLVLTGAVAYLALSIGLAVYIARRISQSKKRHRRPRLVFATVLLGLLLAPLWDIFPDQMYLSHMCDLYGGTLVRNVAWGVEGIAANGVSSKEFLQKHGYRYVEESYGNHVFRVSLDQEGDLTKIEVPQMMSRYRVRSELKVPMHFTVMRHQWTVVDAKTNRVLATRTQFTSSGGWLRRWLRPILGGQVSCSRQDSLTRLFSALRSETP